MGKKKGRLTVVLNQDKPHLGGNSVEINPSTYCPNTWSYIVNKYNIKSVLDVGSGYGHAAKYFADLGLSVTAIEGLEDNVNNAIYPTTLVDLTERSFKIDVDLVNCIEVVEHIEEKFLNNLLDTICCGKYLFMTHGLPGQDGWHHVNNQLPEYWINHLLNRGFVRLAEDHHKILSLSGPAHHVKDSGMLFKRIN